MVGDPQPLTRGQVSAVINMFRSDSVRVDFTLRRTGAAQLLPGKGVVSRYDKTAGRCVVVVENSSVQFDAPSTDDDLQIMSFQIEGAVTEEDVFSVLEGRAALSTVEVPDYVAWLPQLRDDASSLVLRERITRFLSLPVDCLIRDAWVFTPANRAEHEIDNLVGHLRLQLSTLAVTVRSNGTPTSAEMAGLEYTFGRLYVLKIRKDQPKDAEYIAGRLRQQCTLLNAIRDLARTRAVLREKELLEMPKKP